MERLWWTLAGLGYSLGEWAMSKVPEGVPSEAAVERMRARVFSELEGFEHGRGGQWSANGGQNGSA